MLDQGILECEIIEKAARFIYMGLESRRNLSGSREFKELLRSFKNDSSFRRVVKAIASGFYLEILAADHAGVFLRPNANSIFASRLSKIRPGKPSEDKYTGLILIALAAYYFPKDASFEKSSFHTDSITVHKLAAFIREKAENLREKVQPEHVEAGKDQLELLLTSYLQLPGESQLDSKKQNSREYFITRTLKFLEKQKLFIFRDNKYWPTPKFRFQMENMSENDQIRALLNIQ